MKWSRGSLVSCRHHLTGYTGYSPLPHVEWSLPIHTLPVEGLVSHFLLPHAIPPLLCFTLLHAGSARRGQPLRSHSRRHPRQRKGSLSSPLPLALIWSSSRRTSKFTSPPSSSAQVAIDRHLLSTSGLNTTLRRTARVRSSITSTPSPPQTSGSSHHRRIPSPPLDLCGEPPSALPRPMGSPWSEDSPR
jgi:hypothetical protein